MFASLKNKIKEETGAEIVAGAPLPQLQQQQHRISNNNRLRSRFSSTMSINSTTDETATANALDSQHNMFEQLCAMRSQCNELTTKVSDLSGRLQTLQSEKSRVEKTNEILLESVKVAQTQKDIYCEEQEKIQNMQQAEIEKLKSLLSFREQEAVDRLSALRQNQQQIENITGELERLKQIEPMVEDLQESLENDTKELQTRLQAADERFSEYAANAEQVAKTLRDQLAQLQQQLNDEQTKTEQECEEKHTALLRIAEISQGEELLRQELRVERDEANELHERNEQLQAQLKSQQQVVSGAQQELQELRQEMNNNVELLKGNEELQRELNEKNKTIKILNQRLADIKKTLQKEFRSTKSFDGSGESAVIEKSLLENGYASTTLTTTTAATNNGGGCNCGNPSGGIVMDEVNFKYLKHVIVKFLTSREVEARHLIRAVATLLKLSHEEEKLLHDTLNWKMSWFGAKPNHGSGQRAVSIPPTS